MGNAGCISSTPKPKTLNRMSASLTGLKGATLGFQQGTPQEECMKPSEARCSTYFGGGKSINRAYFLSISRIYFGGVL